MQEILPGFWEEETKIQFDTTLIPPAKNAIVFWVPSWQSDSKLSSWLNPLMYGVRQMAEENNLTEKIVSELKRAPLHREEFPVNVYIPLIVLYSELFHPLLFFFYYSGSSPSGNKWQVKLMSLDLSSSFYIISKEKVKANLKLCSTSRERWT